VSKPIDEVLRIGQHLSNAAFNLAQGQQLREIEHETLARLSREWDRATRELRLSAEAPSLGAHGLAALRVDVVKSVEAAFARAGVTPRKRSKKR